MKTYKVSALFCLLSGIFGIIGSLMGKIYILTAIDSIVIFAAIFLLTRKD